MEGDLPLRTSSSVILAFQSTPSVWRETRNRCGSWCRCSISIHSLRMEGDPFRTLLSSMLFISIHSLRMEGDAQGEKTYNVHLGFQSTPSVWRETPHCSVRSQQQRSFQSTPSVWRETGFLYSHSTGFDISIHSLRMEGDQIEPL